MVFKDKLYKFVQNDFFLALVILIIFLLTNGYTYGWDDQHLEIPLLKSLIDSSLYAGDYYVESLKTNFTSFLYPILARIISVEQIPICYFILYLISRYFLFFWIYKLWHLISKNRLTALSCAVMIIVLGRVEEFLYRTFSHQEFALAIILAGIYFFYKERYILAAALLGIAANFHALYSLFPLIYMSGYIIFHEKEQKIKTLAKSLLAFAVFVSPLAIWVIKKYSYQEGGTEETNLYTNWIALYKTACPQNFVFYDKSFKELFGSFGVFFRTTRQYWILIAYYVLNLTHNEKFQHDKKSKTVISIGFFLILFSMIFSHFIPTRFILDLNLVRNTQFMLFILMGHTTLLLFDKAKNEKWLIILLLSISMIFIRPKNYIAFVGVFMLFLLSLGALLKQDKSLKRNLLLLFTFLLLATVIFFATRLVMKIGLSSKTFSIVLIVISILLTINYLLHFFIKGENAQKLLRRNFIIIPLVSFIAYFSYYHFMFVNKVERHGKGFWQMQRNWINMQNFVKENTPKSAMILVPHDMEMGGFRIFSERKIIMSYRDCGVIGFDYKAALEWQERLKDIEAFKIFVNDSIESALLKSMTKYQANYIIFMRYMDPGKNSILEPMYKNDVFALYKVLINPI